MRSESRKASSLCEQVSFSGGVDVTCSAVSSGSSLRQETMMECMSSCSLSSSSSDGSSAAFLWSEADRGEGD